LIKIVLVLLANPKFLTTGKQLFIYIQATQNFKTTMENLVIIAQLVLALSVAFVWIFRFDNIVLEFRQYGLPDLIRNLVGASKISLATLLIAGIWYPDLVLYSSLAMAFLMICAQLAHFKVKNPIAKHFPSLILLIISLFIAGVYSEIINL
jgi:hypothetical protein